MVTPANATQLLCRIMLAVWLTAIVGMSTVVLGGGPSSGNLLAFMFTGPVYRAPVVPPPAPVSEPVPAAPAEPAPPPAPPQTSVAEVSPWKELPHGKKAGRGRILPPRLETGKDGSLTLLFPYAGQLGEHTVITPENILSRSIDIHGQWTGQLSVDTRLQQSCVQRLQIASHKGWIRVSAVARDKTPPVSEVSYTDKELRIVFRPLAPYAP